MSQIPIISFSNKRNNKLRRQLSSVTSSTDQESLSTTTSSSFLNPFKKTVNNDSVNSQVIHHTSVSLSVHVVKLILQHTGHDIAAIMGSSDHIPDTVTVDGLKSFIAAEVYSRFWELFTVFLQDEYSVRLTRNRSNEQVDQSNGNHKLGYNNSSNNNNKGSYSHLTDNPHRIQQQSLVNHNQISVTGFPAVLNHQSVHMSAYQSSWSALNATGYDSSPVAAMGHPSYGYPGGSFGSTAFPEDSQSAVIPMRHPVGQYPLSGHSSSLSPSPTAGHSLLSPDGSITTNSFGYLSANEASSPVAVSSVVESAPVVMLTSSEESVTLSHTDKTLLAQIVDNINRSKATIPSIYDITVLRRLLRQREASRGLVLSTDWRLASSSLVNSLIKAITHTTTSKSRKSFTSPRLHRVISL